MNRRLLRRCAPLVLAAGLAGAAAIYVTAGPEPENPLGYDPTDTKSYEREMEMYGGQANILGSEIREGFASLWRGRRLAYTVAVLSALTAYGMRFVATHEIAPEPGDESAGGR